MFDWHVSLWVYFLWISVCLDLGGYFLSHLEDFLTIISTSIFSYPFFFPSSSGTLIIWMLVHLMQSQEPLRLSSFLFILFFFILLCFNYFHPSSYICFSASVIMLLVSSSISFVSFCCLLLIVCSLFILGPCKIFHVSSSSMPPLPLCCSFISKILDHLYYFYPELFFRQASCFSFICSVLWVLPCSFICCMFLCLFILFNLLCLLSPFCWFKDCSSSYLWCLPSMGGVGPCQAFLVGGTCACVLVDGAIFCLSERQCRVQQ